MSSEPEVTLTDFRQWKADRVTKRIFALLEERREEINRDLTDANAVMTDDWHKHAIKLVGEREGIDLILQIEFGEVEEISGDDEYSSSGTQDLS